MPRKVSESASNHQLVLSLFDWGAQWLKPHGSAASGSVLPPLWCCPMRSPPAAPDNTLTQSTGSVTGNATAS
eukprot:4738057-Pyramimonas_sp.AAC.1